MDLCGTVNCAYLIKCDNSNQCHWIVMLYRVARLMCYDSHESRIFSFKFAMICQIRLD